MKRWGVGESRVRQHDMIQAIKSPPLKNTTISCNKLFNVLFICPLPPWPAFLADKKLFAWRARKSPVISSLLLNWTGSFSPTSAQRWQFSSFSPVLFQFAPPCNLSCWLGLFFFCFPLASFSTRLMWNCDCEESSPLHWGGRKKGTMAGVGLRKSMIVRDQWGSWSQEDESLLVQQNITQNQNKVFTLGSSPLYLSQSFRSTNISSSGLDHEQRAGEWYVRVCITHSDLSDNSGKKKMR